jgi:hypothetical protein
MKTLFQQIVKAAKAKCPKAFLPQARKNPSYKLNPAPSYWLLLPVSLEGTPSANRYKN